jgi:hypothetical protein
VGALLTRTPNENNDAAFRTIQMDRSPEEQGSTPDVRERAPGLSSAFAEKMPGAFEVDSTLTNTTGSASTLAHVANHSPGGNEANPYR